MAEHMAETDPKKETDQTEKRQEETSSLTLLSVREFTDRLSGKDPVPGGGGAAALTAALASALGRMTAELAIGKKRYANNQKALEELSAQSGALIEELLACVDQDAENFLPLLGAYGLPRGTQREKEAREAALSLHRGTVGDNVMYFETGQGTALSANGNWGVDMQTCEARAYAVARQFKPLLVNTVVGFIGPEYLYNGKQIIRAGLEDHFCAKMLGLPMGCDVCYTNHAEADQDDMDTLLTLLAAAGLNYTMGIPGCDDVMLGYQTTSYHDTLYVRQLFDLRPAPEFEAWLQKMKIFTSDNRLAASDQKNNPLLLNGII